MKEDHLITVMQLIRIFSRHDDLASRMGESQGLELIINAMQQFPCSMQLQINASASLANLASIAANRDKMLKHGCIRHVLESMNRVV